MVLPWRPLSTGSTSPVTPTLLADRGAIQCEPGHRLTGTTPLHAVRDLPDLPAEYLVREDVERLHFGHVVKAGSSEAPSSQSTAEIAKPHSILNHGKELSQSRDPARKASNLQNPARCIELLREHARSLVDISEQALLGVG